ncbi:MAG: Ig-like domain-containing protein [bacterium]|nr:Ig-like domain-containing protein [bacterium]
MKRTCKIILLLMVVLAYTALAQDTGDYRSKQNGNWRILATWETWNGTGWVATPAKPGSANNVHILAGDTVTFAASPDSCKNLVVDNGGVLRSNSLGLRYLHVYGDSILNNGLLGGPTDTLCLQFYNDLTISGFGTTELSRIRPGTQSRTLTIGKDIGLHFTGAALTSNGFDSMSFVIGEGSALTFGPSSFFSLNNSDMANASVNADITIAGTVTLQPGMNFNMSVIAGYESSLTLNGGTLNLGDSLVCSSVSTYGSETITINEGGAVNWTSADSLYVDTLILNNSTGFVPGFPMRVRKLELRKGFYDNSVKNLRIHSPGTILRDSGTIAVAPHINDGGSINVVYTGSQAFISGPELFEATPLNYTRLRSLYIENGASLTLTKDILCTRNLYLDGSTISTGAFSMGVKDTAFRYSGHVIGNYYSVFDSLHKVEMFPVGTGNGYSPVVVEFDTVYGEGALMVKVNQGTQPQADPVQTLKRYWTVRPYSLMPVSFDSCAITFAYLDDDFNTGLTPAEEGGMVAGKYDGTWALPQIAARDTAANTIRLSGIISFSDFSLGRDSASFFPPSDTVPPYIISTSPADGATGVALDSPVIIAFSEPMDTGTVDGYPFPAHDFTLTWNAAGDTLTMTPDSLYSQNILMSVVVTAGTDLVGNPLASLPDTFVSFTTTVTGVEGKPGLQGFRFFLGQVAPNPVKGPAEFRFGLAEDQKASLEIYNVLGQRVKTLANGMLEAGNHSAIWDGFDGNGRKVSSGVYVYRLTAGDKNLTRRFTVLR